MSHGRETRCGVIVLAGAPNAGKSTFLNHVVGEKLAITSAKPQSTRYTVTGLRTEGCTQLVFIDPPGLFRPQNLLQRSMVNNAVESVGSADVVLYLHPAAEGPPPPLNVLVPDLEEGPPTRAVVLTKADLVPNHERLAPGAPPFLVSSVTGEGIAELLAWCREHVPVRPFRFDPEDLSTQDLRFFVTELVREAAFEVLDQELPYALAAEVDEFRETALPVYIRVLVHVERDSQKGMVIGRGGATIKTLGRRARTKIESLLGQRVYLDLWVKVLPKWRSSAQALRRLGLTPPPERARNA